jgi:pimeloyl-ACP methyl ester carboxylesterase
MNIDVDGTRLWFDVDGAQLVPDGTQMRERPTVVLLHGGPGGFDHTYFKPEFQRLTEVAQVVYLDLVGHGRSDWGDPAAWSFDAAGDSVRGFCDTVEIERPIVYGHSLGGFVALAYAIRHPDHPRALVLQSTMARFDLDRIVEGFRRAGGDDAAQVAERSYGGQSESVSDEEWLVCERAFGPWVPGEDEYARITVNRELNPYGLQLMQRFDVVEQLGAIQCPTLVCCGELDPVTPPEAHHEIADALGEGIGRLVAIEGAGHWIWNDVPEIYWPLLTEFVRSVYYD